MDCGDGTTGGAGAEEAPEVLGVTVMRKQEILGGGAAYYFSGLRIPVELKFVVDLYQNRYRLTSFNAALRSIIETNPGIALIVQELYDEGKAIPGGSRETE